MAANLQLRGILTKIEETIFAALWLLRMRKSQVYWLRDRGFCSKPLTTPLTFRPQFQQLLLLLFCLFTKVIAFSKEHCEATATMSLTWASIRGAFSSGELTMVSKLCFLKHNLFYGNLG